MALDSVSGFQGVIVAFIEYMGGERRYLLCAPSEGNKPPNEVWVDAARCELVARPRGRP